MDRQVEVVEQATEGPGIPRLRVFHEPLDRGVVEAHNEWSAEALGPGVWRHFMWRTSYDLRDPLRCSRAPGSLPRCTRRRLAREYSSQ